MTKEPALTSTRIFWNTSPEGSVEKPHPAWCAFTGQNEEEIKGFGWTQAVHPDDMEHLTQEWNRAFDERDFFISEYRVKRVDGIYRLFEVRGIPIFNDDGLLREWVGTYIDITERKQLEEHLRASGQRFRATFEQSSIGIAYIDLQGQCMLLNQKFCDIVGYSQEDLVGKAFVQLLPPEDRPSDREMGERFLSRREIQSLGGERRYLHKNRSSIWVNQTATLIHDAEGKPEYFVLVIEDITEKKKSEQRTNDALNALLSMAESLVLPPEDTPEMDDVPLGPTFDPAARYLARLTCKVLDCRSVGLLSLDPHNEEFYPIGVAGVTQDHKRRWWEAQEQERHQLITSFSEEQIAHLRANEVLIIDPGEPQHFSLLAPHLTRVALIAPMKVGEQLVGLLILDHGETPYSCSSEEIALARAVARLAALVIERKRLMDERALAQAGEIAQRDAKQRMETFLGIASHELKTPLTTININHQVADRIIKQMTSQKSMTTSDIQKKTETLQEMLRGASRQAELLNRLVSDLIDVSRIQANKLELHLRTRAFDLATIVQEAIQNQKHLSPGRAIRLSVSPSLGPDQRTQALSSPIGKEEMLIPVMVDPDRIGQVITNYLTNAVRFSPLNTPIEVHLQRNGEQARVSVRDEGVGLLLEEQEQIWQSFYQGRGSNTNAGLGLGLYISRSLIERHNGSVGVQSDPGHGSTFWFTLPLASPQELQEY